ncbi:MAG: hypothetical protein MJZ30_03030 [Paludibacteraceae bacterium]|nr:hypothetical protein [Paludibacteraceae bacterium]
MKKLKSKPFIWLLFTSLALFSCKKHTEIDFLDDSEERPTTDFVIRNDINHSITIQSKHWENEEGTFFKIPYQDSIIRESFIEPFSGMVYVIIDDTIKFDCNNSDNQYNISIRSSYDTIETKDHYLKLRYVINENFYEYAKAHPFTEVGAN